MIETKNLTTAASWVKNENIIAYPTEGVWGIGCIYKKTLVEKLNFIKGREKNKKYILLFQSTEHAFERLNIEKKYKDRIEKLSKSFTTIIVPSGEDSIAIRIPQYPILLQFLDHIGREIVSTSANLSGEPVCKTTNEVKNIFSEKIFGILDLPLGGQKKPSKIFDLNLGDYVR